MDFFDAGLYCAAAICAVGTLWRAGGWLRRRPLGGRERLRSRLGGMLRALAADVLLLRRTWRTNRLRWLTHSLILVGFLGLLVFHAMDGVVTARFFPGYESTLDPWQWLRNLFGTAALLGVTVAVVRRLAIPPLRRLSRSRDWALLVAVAAILGSGFALEASKIVSPAVYQRMTDDYFFPDSGEDAEALRAYWAAEQGMVFDAPVGGPERMPEGTSSSESGTADSSAVSVPMDGMNRATLLARGRELYEESCAICHADTSSAFVSRPLAALLAPAAPALHAVRADIVLWYVHVALCLLALAALPFSKFFHPVAATANLLLRGGRHASDAGAGEVGGATWKNAFSGLDPDDRRRKHVSGKPRHFGSAEGQCRWRGDVDASEATEEATSPTGNVFDSESSRARGTASHSNVRGLNAAPSELGLTGLGMEACTRCAECSLRCSVAPSFAVLGNPDILPSEKLVSLNRYASSRSLRGAALASFAEGSRICTECLRCTEVCASGIDLQRLWMASKRQLAEAHRLDPNAEMRARSASEWVELLGGADDVSGRTRGGGQLGAADAAGRGVHLGLADDAASFHGCVQCTTCTSVCPVVAVSGDPSAELDLTPQQIMNMLRMGLKGQTLGARMVWSCTTCYKCQEHCPQGVPVADVLFELRNVAAEKLRERTAAGETPPNPNDDPGAGALPAEGAK